MISPTIPIPIPLSAELAALKEVMIAKEKSKSNQTAPDFTAALITAKDLVAMQMEKRPSLLGAWMKQGDLGYLFAPRGAGKTWMAMLIGNAIAEGKALGEWQAGGPPRKVIYFDAEMNLADVQERLCLLDINSDNFRLLSNERLFSLGGRGVNIANAAHQAALSAMLPDECVFIIDNLSTAQIGMAENDNDSFDAIRDWLLSFRHRGITVMIIHHAGRNGAMRGSSRREDMAHWIISLKDANQEDGQEKTFITAFEKSRNCQGREAMPLKWIMKNHDKTITLNCNAHNGTDAMLSHIQDGVTSPRELSELLDVQPGTISKWAKKLETAGKIKIANRKYHLIE